MVVCTQVHAGARITVHLYAVQSPIYRSFALPTHLLRQPPHVALKLRAERARGFDRRRDDAAALLLHCVCVRVVVAAARVRVRVGSRAWHSQRTTNPACTLTPLLCTVPRVHAWPPRAAPLACGLPSMQPSPDSSTRASERFRLSTPSSGAAASSSSMVPRPSASRASRPAAPRVRFDARVDRVFVAATAPPALTAVRLVSRAMIFSCCYQVCCFFFEREV
jgi:hypothetical protein